MIELYRKNVWRDERTVNVIASACFSDVSKLTVTALKFFLGTGLSVLQSFNSFEKKIIRLPLPFSYPHRLIKYLGKGEKI
jgi:hypothetical protein